MPSVQTWIEIAASKTLVQCSDLVNVSRHVFPWFGSAASQRVLARLYVIGKEDVARRRIICNYAFGEGI